MKKNTYNMKLVILQSRQNANPFVAKTYFQDGQSSLEASHVALLTFNCGWGSHIVNINAAPDTIPDPGTMPWSTAGGIEP